MKPALARCFDKIDLPDGCWLWTGTKTHDGYGRVHDGAGMRVAHRVVYEALVGPIPEGRDLDHLCRVRHCVNPAHLEPVTRLENLLRGQTSVAAHVDGEYCGNDRCVTCPTAARLRGAS